MGLTRPQRLQQARYSRFTGRLRLLVSHMPLAHWQLLELVFKALFAVSQRRDPTLRLKSKPLLDSRRQPQPYAVDVGKKQHIRLSSKNRGLGRINRPAVAATQDKDVRRPQGSSVTISREDGGGRRVARDPSLGGRATQIAPRTRGRRD